MAPPILTPHFRGTWRSEIITTSYVSPSVDGYQYVGINWGQVWDPVEGRFKYTYRDVARADYDGFATDRADVIRAVGGNDTIDSGGGNDTIDGGTGDDTILGGDGNDSIGGGAGNDSIDGGTGDNALYGGSGNDSIRGGAGNEVIVGGVGNDTVDGYAGADTIFGGAGNDTIHHFGDAIQVDPGGGDNSVWMDDYSGTYTEFGAAAGRTLIVMQYASSDPDLIELDLSALSADLFIVGYGRLPMVDDYEDPFGSGLAPGLYYDQMTHAIFGHYNTLETGSGDDTVYTMVGGRLETYTGDGNDTIYLAGAEENIVYAGAGNDVVDARGDARPTLDGGNRRDSDYSNMNVGMNDGDDLYLGSNRGDFFVYGHAGNDTIRGGSGDDFDFGGGDGNDLIFGGAGDDGGGLGSGGLRGDAGSDTLVGGAGSDTLCGGANPDVFRFDSVSDSPRGGGRDAIFGELGIAAFAGVGGAGGDVIDVSRIDADETRAGNQDFTFGGTGKGRLWAFEGPGGNTLIRGNVDNDAIIEFEILIEDGTVRASAYAAVDFIL